MSSTPEAFVVHRTKRRLRLRVPARRGDTRYFERIARALCEAEGVREVQVDARTASVLVRHDGSATAQLTERAARGELFTWPSPGDDVMSEVRQHLRATDAALQERTGGRWSLESLTMYGLIGAGIWQLAHGQLLPPGMSLISQALGMVGPRMRQGERRARTASTTSPSSESSRRAR